MVNVDILSNMNKYADFIFAYNIMIYFFGNMYISSCLFLCLFLSFFLSFFLSIYLSQSASIYLSIYLLYFPVCLFEYLFYIHVFLFNFLTISILANSSSWMFNCICALLFCLVSGQYACYSIYIYIYIYRHHHHVVPLARISLTLSRHFFLSFIASGRSFGLHPVSSHCCWMHVRAGRPAFARSYVGDHRSTSLMSSSLLLQQCPACLVRLTWVVFVMGGRWPYSWCFLGDVAIYIYIYIYVHVFGCVCV